MQVSSEAVIPTLANTDSLPEVKKLVFENFINQKLVSIKNVTSMCNSRPIARKSADLNNLTLKGAEMIIKINKRAVRIVF